MKIVVIGGTGLIGSKVVEKLKKKGHEAIAAAPNTGVNTITGEGLKEAMAGAQVVIDLANSPSFEDKAVLEFFETSGRNLLAAEVAAGVRRHVALSVVGIDRSDNGYFRAKIAQEKLIETSGIPYTIIRSTQFLEFLGAIADSGAAGNTVRISPGLFQPIAADDVAAIVADVALAEPRNGIVEIAGPERAPFDEIVARYLKAVGDQRVVVSDPEARYFGGRVEERSLVPLGEARLGRIALDEWLRRSRAGGLIPHPPRLAFVIYIHYSGCMDDIETIAAFAALAQTTRLDTFRLLVAREPDGVPAGELARLMAVPQNTMSAHLSVLSRAGLVSGERCSRSIIYRANLARLRELVSFLLKDCCGGRPDVCAPLVADLAPCCSPKVCVDD